MDSFLDWLDEQAPTEAPADDWMCNTIERAEAAARRLRRATDAIAEVDAVVKRVVADVQAWRAEACARHETIADTERANLTTFLRVQIDAGGPKSAPLPWGVSVKARKIGGTLDLSALDPDAAPDEVVRVKRLIDAKAAKEYYSIADDGVVVDPNGEVVDGVTVKPVEDRVEVVA